MRIFRHLQCKAFSDVSCQSYVISRILEDMVYERGCGCLAVTAGDADHLRVGVSSSELYLADDMYPLGHTFLYHRSLFRYAWALDDFVGIEDFLLGVAAFLPLHAVVIHKFLVFVLYRGHVRNEHVETFFLCQYGSSCAALASSKYYYSFHCCYCLLGMGMSGPAGCIRFPLWSSVFPFL